MNKKNSVEYALDLDVSDSLKNFRQRFYIPQLNGGDAIYFLGNSLGLQPHTSQDEVLKIMEAWANFGVEGFFMGKEPWLDYPKKINPLLAEIIGAKSHEVVTMNHLTVNLHLLMVSFYRPTHSRFKIICEAKAFPSDQYALQSQVKLNGFEKEKTIIEVQPQAGTELITTEDIIRTIEAHGNSVSLILMGGVNYYTGQVFDMAKISKAAHAVGALVGFDLAHAAGNIELALHDWEVDFACWCNYKYLNSGPGAIAGAFIHEKNLVDQPDQRLEGWWGNDIENRFNMEKEFKPFPTADAWQLSTPPMMLLAAHYASLSIFNQAGFKALRFKSEAMIDYLFVLLDQLNKPIEYFRILTPRGKTQRGCQVSISVHQNSKSIFDQLLPRGVFADWREPNVIRIAPVPLYNSFTEIFNFVRILSELFKEK